MTKKSIATVSQEEWCVALQGPLDGRSTQSLHVLMLVNGKKSDKYSL